MFTCRDLNMVTSLRVFCGNHIDDAGAREITQKYWDITLALELVNFPLPLPGTKVYRAIQCRKAAMKHLVAAAAKSKIAMASGKEPECMLDYWVRAMEEPTYKGRKDFSDDEMAMVVFSFLFAFFFALLLRPAVAVLPDEDLAAVGGGAQPMMCPFGRAFAYICF